jgi:hypothetical protein
MVLTRSKERGIGHELPVSLKSTKLPDGFTRCVAKGTSPINGNEFN